MDIRPLHDRLIVRRLAEGEQKSGGIIIPDTASELVSPGSIMSDGRSEHVGSPVQHVVAR